MPKHRSKTKEAPEPRFRGIWSGTLSFALVSMPVSLLPAVRGSRSALRMLSPEGNPLQRHYYSPKTGRDLDDDDMVRGYEIDKGDYVPVTDEELERLAPEKSSDIDLKRFVPRDQISPVFFEHGYFVVPAKGSHKAYQLLARSMEKSECAGVGTFVMHGKEHLAAILADKGFLRLETLRFSDEIRSPADMGISAKKAAPASMVRKFERVIGKASGAIAPEQMRDEYTDRLLKLVKKKKGRRKNVVESSVKEESDSGNVVDLMEVLKRSMAQ